VTDSIRQAAQVERALDGRRLMVSGVRGTDSIGLAGSLFFGGSHVLTMHDGDEQSPASYEEIQASRPGLSRFQFEGGHAESKWVTGLRNRISHGIAVVPYKAFGFHQRLGFGNNSWFLGLEPALQSRFDDRSWVEEGLSEAGVSTIPWRNPLHPLALEETGAPLVIRSNRSVGGSGFQLIHNEQDLAALIDRGVEADFSYSPFYAEASHLSTLAVVDSDGEVSLHGISRQLIGLPSLTESAFEYCGNRFGSEAEIDADVASEMDQATRRVGRWMAARGYVGTYGADWLVWGGHVWLAEVNARFTGSVLGSDVVAARLGQSSIYINHAAAFLGVSRPIEVDCGDLLAAPGCTVIHVLSHEHTPLVMTSPRELAGWSQFGRPSPGITVEHGGILALLVSTEQPGNFHRFNEEAARLASEVKKQFTTTGTLL
jgi:hypothetical protein